MSKQLKMENKEENLEINCENCNGSFEKSKLLKHIWYFNFIDLFPASHHWLPFPRQFWSNCSFIFCQICCLIGRSLCKKSILILLRPNLFLLNIESESREINMSSPHIKVSQILTTRFGYQNLNLSVSVSWRLLS